ncbi:MAG: PCMD domain-containing protein [Alistipes indistinctus]
MAAPAGTPAQLESNWPASLGIGKLAAGGLFIGRYVGTRGANGIVGFGRPFTRRPVALRGWAKPHLR